jgi:hypothetical protein
MVCAGIELLREGTNLSAEGYGLVAEDGGERNYADPAKS